MNVRKLGKSIQHGLRRAQWHGFGILRRVPRLRSALHLPLSESIALASLSAAEGRVYAVDPGQTVKRPLPRLPSEVALPWEFARQQSCRLPATFVASLNNGRIWGHYGGAVFTASSALIPELSRDVWGAHLHSAHTRWRLPKLQTLPGSTLSLVTPEATSNYHHWTMDVLPRVDLLQRAGWCLDEFEHVLIKFERRPFQLEGLARLGIPEQKLIFVDDSTHLQTELLVVPSVRHDNTCVSKSDIEFVRRLYLPQEPDPNLARRRIYLSRRDARFRRLTNEAEILQLLLRHGFEEVSLSNMTVADQARLFSEAEVVIGPHGAAFANLVFANRATRVIDLLAPEWIAPYTWITCANLGLDYTAIIGDGPRTAEGALPTGIHQDIQINIRQLREVLEHFPRN